jgi:deoxyribodipyrimidine photo-lyase
MSTSVWWIRRDMRLADNKALQAAAADGAVVPLFVVDPVFASAGGPRREYMFATLRALDADMGGALVVRNGRPHEVVPEIASAVGAASVHIASDFAPYGRRRDARVRDVLTARGIALAESDSNYVVDPGVVRKDDGTPLKVFTPFFKRWLTHDFTHAPDGTVAYADAASLSEGLPGPGNHPNAELEAGERAAWERWNEWSVRGLEGYKDLRNDPGVDATSKLSPYLRFGVVHPRQLLAVLPPAAGSDHFRSEIAWREFYADVLFHQPRTAWENLQSKMDALPVDMGAAAEAKFARFCTAQTGYPIVDAGIRQMLATGWMHNRVRMIVASFLVKDLHLPWQWGAKFFMDHLIDGDIASNNHGWQWTAGTGTDAAPYFRVFNPVGQSAKFDPEGRYLRTWIPEIAGLDDRIIHDPAAWGLLAPEGYPAPMVDHARERDEALARYKFVSGK